MSVPGTDKPGSARATSDPMQKVGTPIPQRNLPREGRCSHSADAERSRGRPGQCAGPHGDGGAAASTRPRLWGCPRLGARPSPSRRSCWRTAPASRLLRAGRAEPGSSPGPLPAPRHGGTLRAPGPHPGLWPPRARPRERSGFRGGRGEKGEEKGERRERSGEEGFSPQLPALRPVQAPELH